MNRMLVDELALVAFVSLAACSAAPDAPPESVTSGSGGTAGATASSQSAASTGGSGGAMSTGGFDAGGGSGGGGFDCSEAAKLVYVVGSGNQLYSFEPSTLAFSQIGFLDCKSNGAHPFSMGVDHDAVAWVLYDDGNVYKVDTANAKCAPSGYQPGQQGFLTFGMGFVRDAPDADTEKLYVSDMGFKGLGVLDTTALTLALVGPYVGESGTGELTGTGDARLFGFFGESLPMMPKPPAFIEIDKQNANVLTHDPLTSIDIGNGWAFAFWGGDFWLFTSPFGESQVDRYDPKTKLTETVLDNIGFTIVGAGVSTCAPLEPPS